VLGSLYLAGLPDIFSLAAIAGPTSGKQWLATGLALVVFLFFYFTFFRTRIAGAKGWL
jgi:hypothetical protein